MFLVENERLEHAITKSSMEAERKASAQLIDYNERLLSQVQATSAELNAAIHQKMAPISEYADVLIICGTSLTDGFL